MSQTETCGLISTETWFDLQNGQTSWPLVWCEPLPVLLLWASQCDFLFR